MISTESVCDLPESFLKKYQIPVIPYKVCTDGGVFLDGIEAESDGVLSYLAETEKNVWSEEPSVKEYEEFFAQQLTKAQSIVHITMARNVSRGYANALEASRIFDNVTIVDSEHLSAGMGIVVFGAAQCAAGGMSKEAVVGEIEQRRRFIRTSFIVDSTEYLVRARRIPARINKVCQALMIHPVITLKKSSMKVKSFRIGARENAWDKYIDSALKNTADIDKKILFIVYAGLTEEELEKIEKRVRSRVTFEKIICQKASHSISANCGPGSFGLLFMDQN